MAKGDVVLVPVVLTAHDPEELAKLVVAERIKKGMPAAIAHYTAVYVTRFTNGGSSGQGHATGGYTKYVAFVEFLVEEK